MHTHTNMYVNTVSKYDILNIIIKSRLTFLLITNIYYDIRYYLSNILMSKLANK